ncbi:Laccase-1 [Hypsizygus marmoreus]|uniref:laccase n=1 Tax=Hypsizygus marmoreus TaxID=39966 RepID=A0A369K673_HYPMA|nr:Laccase-1 [Hypsizygus marmoreus]
MFLSALSTFSFITAGAYALMGPSADMHVVNKDISPDGFTRSAVLVGSTADDASFPGPLITGNKGDNFLLNVIDSLSDDTMLKSTSIHWHGFFQAGSSWADGPVGVTQCPIAPGHSFLYDFSVPDQAGTFWYHSHLSTQYCDGLRGVFVVYDPSDPHSALYDIDDESTVITLADWYHTPAPSAGVVPTPDATLINGLGRFVGGAASPLAVISVVSGKRYRFRLVSMSCDPNYTFSIDGHTMTIIEVDGVNVEPLAVDSIQIFAGQRYSFVLEANQAVSNYWIRADPNAGDTGFDGGINSAILRYDGAEEVDPTTTSSLSNPMAETDLHPLTNPGAPGTAVQGGADVNINLDIAFSFTDLQFTMNGATFVSPTVPVLLQVISGARTASELLPAGSVYVLPADKVIEVSIPGGSVGSPHPFHLHGHTFDVVRSAGSSVYNYANPVRRDVVSVGGASDNVTIRFTTDNPGPWILHCHIDWHLEVGLAVIFAEDSDTVATESTHPTAWDELCPIYDALDASDH